MNNWNRREFLLSSSLAAGGLTALNFAAAADRPNEKHVLAVMGVHGRGRALVKNFSKFPDVEIAYICDPDQSVLGPASREVNKEQKRAPKLVSDFRKALDDKDVTALVIAAPDHWHALGTIWGCQAGKHVYVEKPVSHNLREGRVMVDVARKHNRVVQVGTQRRSGPHFQSAAEFVRSGKLGKVPFARTCIAGNRKTIGRQADSSPPEGVDYNLWLGPAAERPFNANRFHYNWHWNWDTGTGELGNNGIHALDVVRMLLNLDGPNHVSCGGGRLFFDDDMETPDTQIATFDFPNTSVVWEHRIWSKTGMAGESWAVMLYGEKGTMIFDKKGWHVEDGVEASDKSSDFEAPHLRNFLDCVKDGRRPNADVEEGHKSARLCHLGNIAYRTGRSVRFDPATETILDDAQASKLLRRTYRQPFAVAELTS